MSPGQRGTAAQHARRVNAAARLLASGRTVVEAARELARRQGISERQARRYAEQARDSGSREIPRPRVAFTVNLPVDLAKQLRRRAKTEGCTLSGLVTQAVQELLNGERAGRRGGR